MKPGNAQSQAKVADGKLKYASEESKARKLRPSATAAHTHSLPGKIRRHGLEDPSLTRTLHSGGGLGDDAGNQRSTEGPTWMSKWATAVRVLGPSKDPQDFAYMIRQLAKGFHCPEEVKDSFVKPVSQMTREQVEATCKALLATRRIMARVLKECGGDPAAGQDKLWVDALSAMLLPETVRVTKEHDGSQCRTLSSEGATARWL